MTLPSGSTVDKSGWLELSPAVASGGWTVCGIRDGSSSSEPVGPAGRACGRSAARPALPCADRGHGRGPGRLQPRPHRDGALHPPSKRAFASGQLKRGWGLGSFVGVGLAREEHHACAGARRLPRHHAGALPGPRPRCEAGHLLPTQHRGPDAPGPHRHVRPSQPPKGEEREGGRGERGEDALWPSRLKPPCAQV